MPPDDRDSSQLLYGNSVSGLLNCALDVSTLPVSRSEFPENWEPPTPEHIAVLLPQYQIESLIGRGGMGAVYKGRQITLQRPVAIKVLPAELARNTEFVARFHREAQLLASLSHQGIVTIFDFGQTAEGHLYFVMEYVDGTDLYRLIHKSGNPLDAKQALSLIVQICEAMQYAHDKGVVHRDIKPANVLVTRDGRAKLADFGLAMKPADPDAMPVPPKPGASFDPQLSPNAADMRFTQPGSAMGTPDYAAPEVYDGKADERSDIYALGIMLYEMLTGAPPKGYFQLPSTIASVDHRVDQVVVKALEIDPAARYQKASDMQQAVEAASRPLPKRSQIKLPPTVPSRPAAQFPARVPPPAQVQQRPHQSGWFGKLVVAAVVILSVGAAYDAGQKWTMTNRLMAMVQSSSGASRAKELGDEIQLASQAAAKNTSASPAVSTSSAGDPVLGRWWWPGEYIVTFTADGKFKRTDGAHGVWSCDPGKTLPCEYMLRWEGVNVDRLTLNKEATVLDGFIVNYRNAKITAYRVPEKPAPPLGDSTVIVDAGFTPLLDRDHTTGWQHCGEGSITNQDGVFITSTPVGVRDPWGIYWYSARKFSDYVLRAEFAVDSLGSNSGVIFGLPHLGTAKPALSPAGSHEAEIRGTETGCILGVVKDRRFPLPLGIWNDMEITVIGTSVTVKINGQTISAHTFSRNPSGYIGLQNLGCCGSAYFRNVRIKELNTGSSSTDAGAGQSSIEMRKDRDVGSQTKMKAAIPTDAIAFAGRYYRFYPGRMLWQEAKERCESLGGRLGTIPSAGVWTKVRPLARQGAMWLGASDVDKEGQWKWVDGTPVQFTAWRSDQPDNWGGGENYLCTDEQGWIDVLSEGRTGVSTWVQGYLCEWTASGPGALPSLPGHENLSQRSPAIQGFAHDLGALIADCLATGSNPSKESKLFLLGTYRDSFLKEGRNTPGPDLEVYRAAYALCNALIAAEEERSNAKDSKFWAERSETLRPQIKDLQMKFEAALTKIPQK